jgi:Leucine-rich repeat (LRR) protein
VKATVTVESVTLNGWRLLNLNRISEWTSLQDLNLSNTDLRILPNLPKSLRRLIIRDNRLLSEFSIKEGERLSLPLLETFDCAATELISFWVNQILSASIEFGNLRVLSMGHRLIQEPGVVDVATWAEMFPPSHSLKELSMAASDLSEARLLKVVDGYPNLQILDVSFTKITGVAVKHFVKSGVKYLKVNECGEISLDAVAWARGKGVKVDFNFSSQSTALRRFRDI